VDKEFLKYARGARKHYHDYLDEERRKKKKESLHTKKGNWLKRKLIL